MVEQESVLLLRYARERDADAFRALVEGHQDMVFAVCRRVLGNREDARDAAQNCFLKLARHAGKLRAPIAGWLHRVAVTTSVSALRQRKVRRTHEARAGVHRTANAEPTWEQLEPEIDRAIAELPERLRVPLVLYHLEGHTQAEIAGMLGVTQPSVSERLRKAIEALRKRLGKAGLLVTAGALASALSASPAEAAPAALAVAAGKMAAAGIAGGANAVTGLALKAAMLVCLGAAVVAARAVVRIEAGVDPRERRAAVEPVEPPRALHIVGWTDRSSPGAEGSRDPASGDAVHHPHERWDWVDEAGKRRSYERIGSVVQWDDGEQRYDYDEDQGRVTVYVSTLTDVDTMDEFPGFEEEMRKADERGVAATGLGEKTVQGYRARGLALRRDEKRREEYWFQMATDLPVAYSRWDWEEGRWVLTWEIAVEHSRRVPTEIVGFRAPASAEVSLTFGVDPRFDRWRLHLKELGKRYEGRPLPEPMDLVPRDTQERIEAYTRVQLPGIRGYSVWPVTGSLVAYMRSWRPVGSLRLPEELRDIQLNHDLIVRGDSSRQDRQAFVLDSIGLEVTEVTEDRVVWVARYDGRPLKPWHEVTAPVPTFVREPIRLGMAIGQGAFSARDLFGDLTYYQDLDLGAEGPIVVDETGLPQTVDRDDAGRLGASSAESPYWGGEGAVELAREWFEEEFGITFIEDVRPMTLHVLRARGSAGGRSPQ